MDDFERTSLYNCRLDFYKEFDINEDVLKELKDEGLISESLVNIIEKKGTQREKIVTLLQYISSSNVTDSYQKFMRFLAERNPRLSQQTEQELLKERTSYSRDINERLIEVINEQLIPIVYGDGSENIKSELKSEDKRPQSSLLKLSSLIEKLQTKCLKILNEPTRKPLQASLPVLINRKIKEQQDLVRQLRSEINDFKFPKQKKEGKGYEEIISPSEKVHRLRKELQQQHDRVKLLEQSLISKESKVSELKSENSAILNEIQNLKKRTASGRIQVSMLFDDDPV